MKNPMPNFSEADTTENLSDPLNDMSAAAMEGLRERLARLRHAARIAQTAPQPREVHQRLSHAERALDAAVEIVRRECFLRDRDGTVKGLR